MRLKLATTALLLFGIVMLLGWPIMVGKRPPTGPETRLSQTELRKLPPEQQVQARERRRALARWTLRYAIYFLVMLTTFAATAICAALVARQARAEYRKEAVDNLRELIEGTLEDHGPRRQG